MLVVRRAPDDCSDGGLNEYMALVGSTYHTLLLLLVRIACLRFYMSALAAHSPVACLSKN